MSIKDFEELKEKIEEAKQQRSKAEGSLERLRQTLKEEYGLNSTKEAEEKVKELEESIATNTTRLESIMEELEGLADWDSL